MGSHKCSQKIGQLVSSSAKSLHTSVKHISRMIWEHKKKFLGHLWFPLNERNLQANRLILISQAGSCAHCSCEVPRVRSTPTNTEHVFHQIQIKQIKQSHIYELILFNLQKVCGRKENTWKFKAILVCRVSLKDSLAYLRPSVKTGWGSGGGGWWGWGWVGGGTSL